MKQLIYFLMLLPFSSLGQERPYDSDKASGIELHKIIWAKDSSMPVDEIYTRVLRWFGTRYASGGAVIDVQDRAAGMFVAKPIVGSGYRGRSGNESLTINYTLTISAKPGRIKVDFTNFTYTSASFPFNFRYTVNSGNYEMPFPKAYRRLYETAVFTIGTEENIVLTGLEQALNEPDDDW